MSSRTLVLNDEYKDFWENMKIYEEMSTFCEKVDITIAALIC